MRPSVPRTTARVLGSSLLVLALAAVPSAVAVAQVRIVGGIAGTVADNADLAVPGAQVQLRDEGNGVTKDTATNTSGAFAFPDLSSGAYTITVTLQGFQTAVYSKVIVESGRTTELRVKLQVGTVGETITVSGTTPVLERASNTMSGTLTRKDVTELPLAGRNAFTFARLVPGAVAPAGTGSTHYNGMPGGTINPTIDGINNSSNGFKSGGTSFFGTVPARLGAVEEVTVESGGLGGDAGVSGGVNLRFVTRRGTNRYHWSAFEQTRNDVFNANTYFNTSRNIVKPKLRRNDFGGNIGGPLVPTGPWREKLFFFANFEEEYIPLTQTRTNLMLRDEARQGIFRYQTATSEQRTANLLQIAAQNGFPSTQDPVLAAMLAKISGAQTAGTINPQTNLNLQQLSWSEPQKQINYYPTARLDYQISPNFSWMGSWSLYRQDAQGRRLWPLANQPIQLDTFHSSWWVGSTALNWTIGPSTFNEFRYGVQHSGDTTPHRERQDYELNGTVNGLPARFVLPFGLPSLSADNAPITGRHYITTLYDTVTKLSGNHTYKFGANYRSTTWRDTSLDGAGSGGYLGLPRYTIASPAGDPVQSIFNTTSMPGVQTADLANAYALYALMTGRLSEVRTGRVIDPDTLQYSDKVYRENWTSSWFAGAFAQDSWRMTPNLTLNYAFRWEVGAAPMNHLGVAVFPDYAQLLGPSTGLFKPGTLSGNNDPVLTRGKKAGGVDWVNPAPRVGFAWAPHFEEKGFLAKIFGTGDEAVIRGSYDITYYDEGTNMFSATAGNNAGQAQALVLQPGFPGFTAGGLSLQSALPPFVATPAVYKDVWSQSEFTFGGTGLATMKNDLKMPSVQAWNIGVQREIMKNTVLEVRYVGNRASNVWHTYNVNEVNIFENGFLQEFKNAQQNLAINQANGVASFANNGLPGQVALPIFQTAFGARGTQAALPVAQGFTNGGFITQLQQGEAGGLANTLATNVNYVCRMFGSTFSPCATRGYDAAGTYPVNFFVANPYAIGGALRLVDDTSFTRYHGLQTQLRRRYAGGVTMNVNYTLAKNTGDLWADNATQDHMFRTLRDTSLDEGPTPFDVRHVLQAFGTYDLPIGADRRVRIANPILDGVIGGWTLGGVLTAQSGSPFRLTSGRFTVIGAGGSTVQSAGDSGVVLRNGLTVKDLQKMVGNFPGPGQNRYFLDPRVIGADGRANADFIAPPTTPGEFGQFIWLRSPSQWNFDLSMNKQIRLPGGGSFVLHATAVNVFNHPVWGVGPQQGGVAPGLNFLTDASVTSTTFGQVARPVNSAREFYLRAEIRF